MLHPLREHKKLADGNYELTVRPPSLMELRGATLILTPDQFRRYQMWLDKEGLIQELLSDLTPAQREMILTGINEDEWKTMFA